MEKPYSNKTARRIIDQEGLYYAVTSYCSAAFANPTTRALWKQAGDALNALKVHLDANLEEE